MTHRHAAIVLLCLAAGGCADAGAPPVAPPASPGAAVQVVTRTATTITGQPLEAPPVPYEVAISTSELPAGGLLPMHKHPWPRYAYVERGRLEVRYEASGLVRQFAAGEAVVEAVDQWHEGRVVGTEPVRLVIVDQLPPGQSNVVRR